MFVFALQASLPLRRCPFYMSAFFGSHASLVFPSSPSLPSAGRDGVGWSRDALVLLPEGEERGGGASGRVFGARELASVSSVPLWTRDSGVAPWRRTPATCSVPVGSPSSTLHALRGVGEGEFSGAFLCSRLPLPPHLCTLSEVVGRVSRPSTAPVRVLPGLPILGLGSQEGVWACSWLIGFRVRSCCSRCRFTFRSRSAVETLCVWIVSFAGWLCAIVGGLRTARILVAFALVVSVWPVAVFSDR